MKVGTGKTTIFNKICDENRDTANNDFSATRTYARYKTFYQGKELVIFDGPGCKSKKDTYNHSYVMRHGLTHEPLNGIFIFVEYNARIGSNMADDFWLVAKLIKPEYMHMVVLVATKMDQFQPGGSLQSRAAVQEHICKIFADDHEIHHVVFSDCNINKQDLFSQMYDAVKDKAAVKLEYTDVEFLQYFDLKAWKGKEQCDLFRNKNRIQAITSSFHEALCDLETRRTEYSDDEWQDFIFSAIQQCHKELEEQVMDPFKKRNGEAEMEFEDYAAYIELRRLVHSAHCEVREQAKHLLPINPDDTSNWRNTLRRCQYCGEVWVKVEGCDDETTCGLIPDSGDPWGNETFFQCMWAMVGERWRPNKVRKSERMAAPRARARPETDRAPKVGCGRQIVWKDQAILPLSEVEALFSTQELMEVLSSFSTNTDFVTKKNKKEENIVVFSELGADGKVIDP